MRVPLVLAALWSVHTDAAEDKPEWLVAKSKCGVNSVDVFSHKAQTLAEEDTTLEQHRGNVILLVNVATF
jgi:hypothetical protein